MVRSESSSLIMLTHSAGFKHDYLPAAVEAVRRLAATRRELEVTCTEDCSVINAERLERASVVLFATTGELPMTPAQRGALLDFVREGGGFVGVHNAADTFYTFGDYGSMLGGYFNGHPWTQEVRIKVEDRAYPSTRHLPATLRVREEVYTFKNWSRRKTHVLISLDTGSVDLAKGNRDDNDYALSWCHRYGEGRVFYTAFGHFKERWAEEWFTTHLWGGILWSAEGTTERPEAEG
ncbi:MAG: ThuA domain-containing protein [Nitrososphaerota archaeon]|nr:ThuA domain-containing protein [Nitrososphaerota archaeon]MDG6955283.1 ThuA domain-containing protein [Nitrososphaerota archaeon]